MRFHVLGLPHTVSSKKYVAYSYTQKVVKFCKMMKNRGHYIIHYGHEESDVICDEHVTVLTTDVFNIVYGTTDWKNDICNVDITNIAYKTFYKNAIEEIGKRKQLHDFLLPFWGSGVREICDAHSDMIVVEPGIGYGAGHWCRWKIFESYAIYHAYCGLKNVNSCHQDNYDVVIPNYFDLEDFEYSEQKEDYFLYLGRVYDGKGVNIAIEVTKYLGYKLKIAGSLNDKDEKYKNFPSHVEFIGHADFENRKQLMKKAKGSFLPSQYLEPFGGVQIENLLSGTPTITTDWGAFTENNINGVTGYRCRTFDDYLKAAISINKGEIDYKKCREHGEKFSLNNIAVMYEKYFQDVLNVYTCNGWYKTEIPKINIVNYMFDRSKINPEFLINYSFDTTKSTPLCEIMGRQRSDKGSINIESSWHNYTTFYYSIFKNLREKQLRVFELGLGTNNINIPSNMGSHGRPGASLYGWYEFFKNSYIFGADIDPDILFNTDKIKTFYCDQTKPEIIKKMWDDPSLQDNFDIIIEDGLHTFSANVCFFENSIHKLKSNGYFIIEDILVREEYLFENKIKEWEIKYKDCLFTLLKIPSTCNNFDNNLLVVFKSAT